jgi:2-hydroxy-6-oxonona-2,4-dienedioate hydrolase
MPSPAEFIADLDRKSRHHTTPNGAGTMAWRTWGEGRPVVLLHGGTGSWLHWLRNIAVLAQDFQVLVPDLPGSGESDVPPQPTTAASMAAIVRAGIAALIGAETEFAIVGFSMGGLISGYLAGNDRTHARTLVLAGSSGTEGRRNELEPMQSWFRLPTVEEKLAAHRKNLGILMIHDPAKIDDLAVLAQATNAGQSRTRGRHVTNSGVLSQCLTGFPGRLAGIWGEFDATNYPYLDDRRERLKQFNPNSTFDVIPGAGHWVQYEAHEAFNRRLLQILNGA